MRLIDADIQAVFITEYILKRKGTFLDVLEKRDNDFLFALMMDYFNEQPTIERPKGKWILSGGYWRCSECKEKALLKFDKSRGGYNEYKPVKSNSCPYCGAKMEGKNEL